MVVIKFHEFDFSKRHCWGPNKDGGYTVDGTWDERCTEYKNHSHLAGASQFMRWIREFGILAPNIVTGFEDGWLKLGETWCDTYRQDMYCENYGDKVKAFLDPKAGVALVEIFDPELITLAEQATILVDEQYKEMES